MANENVTAQRLRDLLRYEPETGEFIWRAHRKGRHSIEGKQAGFVNRRGYRIFGIDGRPVQAHRAAWLYVHGEWPDMFIDHINGNRGDNRLENLRDVIRRTNQENLRIAKANNKTGFLGVRLEQGLYRARIKAHGKTIHLGMFEKPEDASDAYIKAKRELHVGCTI